MIPQKKSTVWFDTFNANITTPCHICPIYSHMCRYLIHFLSTFVAHLKHTLISQYVIQQPWTNITHPKKSNEEFDIKMNKQKSK